MRLCLTYHNSYDIIQVMINHNLTTYGIPHIPEQGSLTVPLERIEPGNVDLLPQGVIAVADLTEAEHPIVVRRLKDLAQARGGITTENAPVALNQAVAFAASQAPASTSPVQHL
jgi:hypothetical protein